MKYILLNKNKKTLVDEEAFEKYSQFKWHINLHGYAMRTDYSIKPKKNLLLHRLLINASEDEVIDHINGNKLDNRKENLRVCSIAENVRNQKLKKSNKSGYKGVSFHSINKKWIAHIKINRKSIYLGSFLTPEEAHKAYCEAAVNYHKEFARFK